MTTIQPPKTYSEWVEILKLLKEKADDVAVLNAMQKGNIEWQSGVAERFSAKLIDVINSRMNEATDKFQRDLSYTRGQESLIVQALITLRKELDFLSKAINLPVIPECDRSQYYQLVRQQADSIQASLEDSAKNDRTGRMLNIIRSNKVNAF